jgi:glycosyltransferase involved in cell wall biosynthesis
LKKIAWIHIDIKDRVGELQKKLYPKSHLWGFPLAHKQDIHVLNPLIDKWWLHKLSNFYDFFTKSRFGNIIIELSLITQIKNFASIYCVSGKLFWIPILKKLRIIDTKLIILIYRIPKPSPYWKLHNLHLSTFILSAYDGINCLTQKTANELTSILGTKKEIKYIPWCTDEMFFYDENKTKSKYFFSSGKTNRDYKTLLHAIEKMTDQKFLLIGHFPQSKKLKKFKNLKVLTSEKKQTDTAISYEILKNYISESIAVCIPLNFDPNDTCGFTEMLEAMSMGKPILMTNSGCLDIDIEKEEIGLYVNPEDATDWIKKINYLINNPRKAKQMGEKGRKLIKKVYNLSSYENRIHNFLNRISTSTN